MSRSRATAVFAALVTMMAMMTGAVTLTSTAASATRPPPSYTPVAPVFRVNTGSVQLNKSIRATGFKYAPRELVYLTITYPRVGARPGFVKTIRTTTTNGQTFSIGIKLISSGYVTIRARGATSNKPKILTVRVTAARRGR
jgi:hypothetical protein